jgi:pyruvate kinase
MAQLPSKKTKIVCTIGPASESSEVLSEMIRNGMNIARLNFAHGDFDGHRQIIENIRGAAADIGERLTLMADLPGPKLRIDQLVHDPVELVRGQPFIIQTDPVLGDSSRVSINFKQLPEVLHEGDKIFINDGFIQLKVLEIIGNDIHTSVEVGGELRSFKGVNLPGVDLGICAFTERDHECLKFARDQGIDAISQSFVQEAHDIHAVREAAEEMDYDPFIIAKIERARAVDNMDEILACTDGIMVARGDLGVEIPIEEIALVQKQIIRKANVVGKPVITATQMLESMVDHSRPTRAESTDVANAILDGTDCVMLSEETAMGRYPAEAVAVMTRIACVIEPFSHTREIDGILEEADARGEINTEDLISLSIDLSVKTLDPVAVITPTMSGATARRVSRFRLPVWIIAVSPSMATCQGLQFSYGVYPIHEHQRPENWAVYARDALQMFGISGELALLTKGTSSAQRMGTNVLEIIDLTSVSDREIIW